MANPLSGIWERIRSRVRAGLGWVSEVFAIRSFGGLARKVLAPVADLLGKELTDFIVGLADGLDGIIQVILDPIKKAWAILGVRLAPFFSAIREVAVATVVGFRWVDRVAIPAVRRWIMARIREVRDALRGAIAGVRRWASARISDLWKWTRGFSQWVRDNVLIPLGKRILGIISWATARISELWRWTRDFRQWVIDNVLQPLWAGLNNLIHLVATRVMTAVRLVEDAIN
ncbi:MAG: hypothetical protein IIA44_14770, partial [Acidobacteria bacterium]|nr:hypothetical protein [Acidobacteriota bacterium]